ncbi:MAG: di-trans,poly-cis-decaprenylcistransferase [Chloroflexi bacterium]|nr:di-trans,poly-cis-decaprenylcistransferase [Chloroflexota bacterium]
MAEEQALTKIPQHVGIIMDGNGRWAQARGLPRLEGHRAGTENIRRVLEACGQYGVKTLTIYAFSTENWSRPDEEVKGLFRILEEVIDREVKNFHRQGVRLRHLGSLEGISESMRKKVQKAIELTKDNKKFTLNVAFNYGGRAEILDAVRKMIAARVAAQEVDEERMEQYLYTAGQPPPDLIIRTGGEMRLSNFLIWQAAYAEYYSTPTFWPDFDTSELYKALLAYQERERKFGGLPEKVLARG